MKRLTTILTVFAALAFAFNLNAQSNLQFFINAPGGLAGQYEVGPPADNFGGNLLPGQEITGDLAIVMDSNPNDTLAQQGCDSLINGMELMGNIALIRRGSCSFSDKVFNAGEAGAVGAIVCNNLPGGGAITMGAATPGLATIPSGFLSYEDCELIIQELGAGGTVNITLRVPGFDAAVSSYCYHTPQSQIIPIDIMQVTLFNTTDSDQSNVEVTATITDPDGVVTVNTEIIETFIVSTDSTVTFAEYTPAALGEYSVVFSNSLNDDIIEAPFVITEDVWAPDNGNVDGAAGPSEAQFATANSFKYHVGSLNLTGDENAVVTHVSFSIANAPDFFTGDPNYDVLTIVMYNGDADGDDVIDFAAANASFDDLTPIALGNYVVTGTEDPNEMIMVPLISTTPGADKVELLAGGAYYASVQYNGDATDATVAPAFGTSNDVTYLNFPTTPIFIDVLYTGWAGEVVACRTIIDLTVGTEDLVYLDEAQVQLSPNPAADFVNMDLSLTEMADKVRVDIINYNGQVVYSEVLQNVQEGTFTYDVNNLPAGYYFLSVKTPEGFRSVPFTVAR